MAEFYHFSVLKTIAVCLVLIGYLVSYSQAQLPIEGISTNPDDIIFRLYPNLANSDDSDTLIYGDANSISNSRYNPNKNLIVYASGFFQNATTDQAIKNAYLRKGFTDTSNIIVVDWGALSGAYAKVPVNLTDLNMIYAAPWYVAVVGNAAVVGGRLGEFLLFLFNSNFLLNGVNNVHLVGQSLGAHAVGFAAKKFTNTTGLKFGRVTGTDPAGPLFTGVPPEMRLAATDAQIVDVSHTDQGKAGYLGPMGTVDFFINGGGPIPQDGCAGANITQLFCSHNAAVTYFKQSILDTGTPTFKSFGCASPDSTGLTLIKNVCLIPLIGSILCPTPVQYGEYMPASASGSYCLNLSQFMVQ